MGTNKASLDRFAAYPDRVFQAASSGLERVAQGDLEILVRVVLGRVTGDHQFPVRHGQVDAHVEQVASMTPARRGLRQYPTGGDPGMEPFESFDLLEDALGDIDGDGTADLLVGAPGPSCVANNYAHILSGADGSNRFR